MTGGRWAPGDVVLGTYEVRDVMAGGMGVVYRVWHREWDVDLAVKEPRQEVLTTHRGLSDFVAEAQTWVRLGLHPHTVRCVYVREIDGLPRVFADWVDGVSLAGAVWDRSLYAGGPGPALARVLDTAIQFAWGLQHAHGSGLIHRDVKPANVMVGRDGRVQVTDFGLAKVIDAAAGDEGDGPGDRRRLGFSGTPAYCSPEQVEAPSTLTRATDVWSWALSVLEMFLGHPPTRFGHVGDVVLADVVGGGRPADASAVALPPAVADLLSRCLVRDPARRATDLAVLADELISVHDRLVGVPYARERPEAAALLADDLSNQALSLLDLGRTADAEARWEEALRADPHHVHTIHNRGLHRWRADRITDLEFLAELEEVRGSHPRERLVDQLLGLVHLERADPARALPLLQVAAREPALPGSAAAVERAQQVTGPVVHLPADDGRRRNAIWGDQSIAVSADRRWMVTGHSVMRSPPLPDDEGGAVRVWDMAARRCVHVLAAHGRSARSVAVGGRVVASGGDDRLVLVWDLLSGHLLHRFDDHVAQVVSVALSADGALLVSADEAGFVRVRDTRDGRCVWKLDGGPTEYNGAVALREEAGRVVLVKWASQRLRTWDLTSGELTGSVQLYRVRLRLGAGGRYALAAGDDGRVRLMDLVVDRTVRTLPCEKQWETFAVDGDGHRALADAPGGVQVWDLTAGRCLYTLPDTGYVTALGTAGGVGVVNAGGTLRVVTLPPAGPAAPWSYARPGTSAQHSLDAATVRRARERADRLMRGGRWSAAAAALRPALLTPGYERNGALLEQWAAIGRGERRTGVLAAWQAWTLATDVHPERYGVIVCPRDLALGPESRIALSRDGRWALTLARTHSDVWDLATGDRVQRLTVNGVELRCATFSRDGRRVVAGATDAVVRAWDVVGGALRHELRGHSGTVDALTTSADGRLVLSGCRDGTVRMWDLGQDRCVRVLSGAVPWINTLAVSADARVVVAGGFAGYDGAGSAWGGGREHAPRAVAGTLPHITPAMLSGDGRTLLTTSADGGVLVSNPVTGEVRPIATPPTGHDPVRTRALAVGPDGRLAQAADDDGVIRVWDLHDGCHVHDLTGHRGAVTALAPADDGHITVSGGDDGTVRVWDVDAGRCLRVLDGRCGKVAMLALSDDARTLLVVGGDRTVRVWRLAWEHSFGNHRTA